MRLDDLHPAIVRVGIAAVVTVLFAGAVAVGMVRGEGRPDVARVRVDGSALIDHADGTSETVTGTRDLRVGDEVQVQRGSISVETRDGSTLEGRTGRGSTAATRLRFDPDIELLAGDLLVVTETGTFINSNGNVLRIDETGETAARLHRSLAFAVALYRGAAVIDSAGQRRPVRALREMEVTVLGQPPLEPRPMRVDPSDPWDERFLGAALQLGTELAGYSRTYSASLRTDQGRTAVFYETLLPPLGRQDDFDDDLLRSVGPARPQGDLLVGAAIAMLGRYGNFPSRWHGVFDFYDAGAGWGLVALDQGVSDGPLRDIVRSAVDHTPFPFTPNTPEIAEGTTTTSVPGSPGTTTPGTPSTTPPTTTPTTQPPVTIPPIPPDPQQTVGSLVDTLGQLLGGLLGPSSVLAVPPGRPGSAAPGTQP